MNKPSIAVVIPTHGRLHQTRKLVSSILFQTIQPAHVIISDSKGDPLLSEYIRSLNSLSCSIVFHYLPLSSDNFWTGAVRQSLIDLVSLSSPFDCFCIMNNDVVLKTRETFSALSHYCCDYQIVVSPINLLVKTQQVIYSGARSVFPPFALFYPPFVGSDYSVISNLSNVLQPMDVLGFQCTFVPAEAIYRNILPDDINLPHYHADGEWCLRLHRFGYPSFTCLSVCVDHDNTSTGPGNNFSTSSMNPYLYFKLLFDIRSPRHLLSRYKFHCCILPFYFIPLAIISDLLRFFLSYILLIRFQLFSSND